jgi:hypothetical protein
VNTKAAATIQPVTGANSPFLVCGNSFNRDGENPPLLLPPIGTPANADPKTVTWSFNTGQQAPATPTAIGVTYDIHSGNQNVLAHCGSGSSFKGLNNCNPDSTTDCFALPGWIDGGNGTRTGPTRVATQNACLATADPDNCVLLVPICVDGTGNGNSESLYCVAIGAFLIHSSNGVIKHTGTFQGGVLATGGQTGTGDPTAGSVNIIKLFQ